MEINKWKYISDPALFPTYEAMELAFPNIHPVSELPYEELGEVVGVTFIYDDMPIEDLDNELALAEIFEMKQLEHRYERSRMITSLGGVPTNALNTIEEARLLYLIETYVPEEFVIPPEDGVYE